MAARADLHCHLSASQVSKLGVQRALGLPECATLPEAVYDLAKRRGMDFVTITDHDTLDGVLQIADRSDVFISEELTARFRGDPQAVHVPCWGITPDDHEWLQAHAGEVEVVAEYLREHEIACALAHPSYCSIRWINERALVETPGVGRPEAEVLDAMTAADWVGIDAPFGWPDALVEAIHRYATENRWPAEAAPEGLRYRTAD
jgi:hypothetical protein